MATTPRTSTISQRRLAPEKKSAAQHDGAEHERGAQVRLDAAPAQQRRHDEAGPEERAEAADVVGARGEVVRQHHREEDLGHLAELELQSEDRDPALNATDTAADHQREHQQGDAEAVDRPRERAQPVVVGGGGGDEDDSREREPDEAAHEDGAGPQWVARRSW